MHGAAVWKFIDLRHIHHPQAATSRNFACIRRFQPGQNLQQRRFAGSVRTNYAQPIILDQSHGYALKERARDVCFR
jgi:hypothetical protein